MVAKREKHKYGGWVGGLWVWVRGGGRRCGVDQRGCVDIGIVQILVVVRPKILGSGRTSWQGGCGERSRWVRPVTLGARSTTTVPPVSCISTLGRSRFYPLSCRGSGKRVKGAEGEGERERISEYCCISVLNPFGTTAASRRFTAKKRRADGQRGCLFFVCIFVVRFVVHSRRSVRCCRFFARGRQAGTARLAKKKRKIMIDYFGNFP